MPPTLRPPPTPTGTPLYGAPPAHPMALPTPPYEAAPYTEEDLEEIASIPIPVADGAPAPDLPGSPHKTWDAVPHGARRSGASSPNASFGVKQSWGDAMDCTLPRAPSALRIAATFSADRLVGLMRKHSPDRVRPLSPTGQSHYGIPTCQSYGGISKLASLLPDRDLVPHSQSHGSLVGLTVSRPSTERLGSAAPPVAAAGPPTGSFSSSAPSTTEDWGSGIGQLEAVPRTGTAAGRSPVPEDWGPLALDRRGSRLPSERASTPTDLRLDLGINRVRKARLQSTEALPIYEESFILANVGACGAEFAELSKLTMQTVALGVPAQDELGYYFQLVFSFLDMALPDHPVDDAAVDSIARRCTRTGRPAPFLPQPQCRPCPPSMPVDPSTRLLQTYVSVCSIPTLPLFSAVLVALFRCLHTRGIPSGPGGIHANGPARTLQGCLRRLLQLFGVIVHHHPDPPPDVMALHVYFTDLLTAIAGVKSRQYKLLPDLLTTPGPLGYLLRVLRQVLDHVAGSNRDPTPEQRKVLGNVMEVLHGLALHTQRPLQVAMQQTFAGQWSEGLDLVAMLVTCLSWPDLMVPASRVLRELARDCDQCAPLLLRHLQLLGVMMIYGNAAAPLDANLQTLLHILEAVWWVCYLDPKRFWQDGGKAIIGALMVGLLKFGELSFMIGVSAYAQLARQTMVSQPKVMECYDSAAFCLSAFYVSLILHRCTSMRTWIRETFNLLGPEVLNMAECLEALSRIPSSWAAVSHRRGPLQPLLGASAQSVLSWLLLSERYFVALGDLNDGLQALPATFYHTVLPGMTADSVDPDIPSAARPPHQSGLLWTMHSASQLLSPSSFEAGPTRGDSFFFSSPSGGVGISLAFDASPSHISVGLAEARSSSKEDQEDMQESDHGIFG